jgi:hypothetical protein
LSREFPAQAGAAVRYSVGASHLERQGDTVGYLAGLIAIAFVVFGWGFWPVGWVLIGALLLADFVLET